MGGGDDNVRLAEPNNDETNSGDGNDDVLDENRNNEGGKDVCDDANVACKSSDGDNGDGDNLDGIVNSNVGNDSNYVGNPPVSGDAVGERKTKVKTRQQSKGGGVDSVGLDVPNHNEQTHSGGGNDNDLDKNRSNEGGKDICNDDIDVGESSDCDNGDGDNSDGIVNNIGGNDSNNVGNPPVSGDAVGERQKKVTTRQQSIGGGNNNVGLDGPNHNNTNSSDGYDDVLDENRNYEGGKDICNDANNIGKVCDADNGDGDKSDGIVNNIGGNDSNDVGNPPESGDAIGERTKKGKKVQLSTGGGDNNCGLHGPNHNETNIGDGYVNVLGGNRKKEGCTDFGNENNFVGKASDGDNGDGDNSDCIVNNIDGNDSNDVVNPPDSGDAFGEVNIVSGTSPSPRSPRKGTA
jgi:hypothetical protein